MSDADDPEAPAEDRGGDGPTRDVVRVDGADESAESDGDSGREDGPPVGRDGVMDPDDLDIRDRDEVDETDDGRYVISTGGGRDDLPDPPDPPSPSDPAGSETGPPPAASTSAAPPAETPASPETAGNPTDDGGDETDRGDEADPLAAVAAELGALSSSHGFALAVAAGGETDTLRVASADATDTLATALRWYARRVNPGAPAEETIAALLADSDLDLDSA